MGRRDQRQTRLHTRHCQQAHRRRHTPSPATHSILPGPHLQPLQVDQPESLVALCRGAGPTLLPQFQARILGRHAVDGGMRYSGRGSNDAGGLAAGMHPLRQRRLGTVKRLWATNGLTACTPCIPAAVRRSATPGRPLRLRVSSPCLTVRCGLPDTLSLRPGSRGGGGRI